MTISPKKVFVTGANGLVGAYLVRQLLQSGYQVRAIKRERSQLDLLADAAAQVEWVTADVLDAPALYDALQGVEQVYHCAAVVSFDPRDRAAMYQTNVNGTANVVNMSLERGVKKLVHVSSIAALGRVKNGATLTENQRWENNYKHHSHYAITKQQSEQEVWRGAAEGLQVGIVNPSMVIGAGYWQSGTCGFFTKVWNGLRFCPVGATGFVDVRDVARGMIALMESDIAGKRFILNGENATYRTFFDLIAKHLGVPSPNVMVTPLLGETAWRVDYLKSLLTRSRPLVTRETYLSSRNTFFFDAQASVQQLGMQYTDFETTIAQVCRAFVQSYPAHRIFGLI